MAIRPFPRRMILGAALALTATAAGAGGMFGVIGQSGWVTPGAAGGNAAGYFTLANPTAHTIVLTGAASPAAARVRIHQSRTVNGISSMRPVARVTIAPHATVAFAPGGFHLMFEGLKRPLKAGERIPVDLISQTGPLHLIFTVRNMAPRSSMPGMAM